MKVCKQCNKEFTHTHNRQEYCSEECRSVARREQNNKALLKYYKKKLDV